MAAFIGIDTSTTSTKAIAIDESGEILGVSSSEYSYETPFPLWSEQEPHLWWTAAKASVQDCIKKAGIPPSQIKVLV